MTPHSWPEVLSALVARTDLSAEQSAWAMGEVLAGEATPVQIAGFAVALRSKGETIEELQGLVEAMYARATPLEVSGRVLDVVGTGGDRSMSVNISTMAAIVAAGAGAPVVKHGNRSASSKAGSADVLEALGIRLDLPATEVAAMGEKVGITFCFAAAFHPALRHAAVPRRELGVATTFNFLGPLAHPARPQAQAIGCADARMAPLMAGVFARRGVDAWVFRGDDGLDELTTTTTSQVWAVTGGAVSELTVDPADYGLGGGTAEGLRGGDAAHNAEVVRRLVAGDAGPVRDAVVLERRRRPGRPRGRARPGGAAAGRRDRPGGGVDRLGCRSGRAGALGEGVRSRLTGCVRAGPRPNPAGVAQRCPSKYVSTFVSAAGTSVSNSRGCEAGPATRTWRFQRPFSHAWATVPGDGSTRYPVVFRSHPAASSSAAYSSAATCAESPVA